MDEGMMLYRRYLDGDEAAFSEIIERYRDPVTFFVQRYIHDLPAAEDIAMDTFMELIVHPKRYNFKDSLKTYLFMMARSRALDHLRREKRRPAVPIEDQEELLADEQSLEESVLQNERARLLHHAIAQLPDEQQTAVHLVYFEDRSYEDTAQIMKKTRKQVDNMLYRAKKALKELIGEEAVS